jgi:AcrR family transcriptional regulator
MQVLKEEVRQTILDAAKNKFSEKGFKSTTLAEIAKEAGISVGNIYLYFESKTDLFYEAIPQTVVIEFRRLLTKKVSFALGKPIEEFAVSPLYLVAGDELLTFLFENRLEVITISEKSEGTIYQDIKSQLIQHLVSLFGEYAADKMEVKQDRANNQEVGIVVNIVYANLFSGIVELLKFYKQKEQLSAAINRLIKYHIKGLTELL